MPTGPVIIAWKIQENWRAFSGSNRRNMRCPIPICRRLTPTYQRPMSRVIWSFSWEKLTMQQPMCRLSGARNPPFYSFTRLFVYQHPRSGPLLVTNVVVPFLFLPLFQPKAKNKNLPGLKTLMKAHLIVPCNTFRRWSWVVNHVEELLEARVIWSSGLRTWKGR